MTPAELSAAVRAAVQAAVDAGDLVVAGARRRCGSSDRKVKEHGDYATSVALQLAKPAGRPPREVAEAVAARLREADGVAAVDVAGPGFLNITLDSAAQGELARTVVEAGEAYGSSAGLGRAADQPRVRLGQPHRAAAPRARPVGRGRRRPRAGSCRRPAPRSPASTTSTTRGVQIDRFAGRCSPPPRASRRPRTATAARTSARSRPQVVAAEPGGPRPARRPGGRRCSGATAWP